MIEEPQTKKQPTLSPNLPLSSLSIHSPSPSPSLCPIPHILSLLIQTNPLYQPYSQQLNQFLFYLHLSQYPVTIIPGTLSTDCIQIYNMRDGRINNGGKDMVRYRINKKRSGNGNERKIIERLLFRVEESLCFNCILLMLATGNKVSVGFGVSPQERISKNVSKDQALQKQQEYSTNQKQSIKTLTKEINIFPKIMLYLTHHNATFTSQPQPYSLNENLTNPISFFKNLTQLIITIDSQNLRKQQWFNSMNIGYELLKIVSQQNMLKLQQLQFNIRDGQIYELYVREQYYGKLMEIVDGCYSSIKNILESKINRGEVLGHFPRLSKISFNPVFYMMAGINQHEQQHLQLQSQQQQQEQQSGTQTPLQHLTLCNVTSSINTLSYLTRTIKSILPYFPTLVQLSLTMCQSFTFDYFNQLAAYLPIFTPYIQSLEIKGNNAKTDKVVGLKTLLRDCGYLSTIDIQLCPRFEEEVDKKVVDRNAENNGNIYVRNPAMNRRTPSEQFIREWNIVKQILFKSHHIQRLLNQIRVLQSKGYDTSQCVQTIQLLKPLKLKSMFT